LGSYQRVCLASHRGVCIEVLGTEVRRIDFVSERGPANGGAASRKISRPSTTLGIGPELVEGPKGCPLVELPANVHKYYMLP